MGQLDFCEVKTSSMDVRGLGPATKRTLEQSATFTISIKAITRILCGIFSTTSTSHYSKLTSMSMTVHRDLFVGRFQQVC